MSRRSIDSRMDRIVDKLLPPGSMERREHFLPPDLREALQTHRTRVSGIIARAEKSEPDGAAGALLDGTLQLPAMPSVLRDALGLVDPPSITEHTSSNEASEIYNRFAHGKDDQ